MAVLNKAKTLTAVALAATAFTALPATASAKDYRCENKNDEAQVIGGILGAVVGGVVGSEVAGRGDKNEGAVIGAILGAGAGAALGDESVKCRREVKGKRNRHYARNNGHRVRTTTYTQPTVVTTRHNGHHRGYDSHHRGHGSGYYNGQSERRAKLNRINRRLDALRAERAELKYRQRHDHSRWINRRLREINDKIVRLKARKRSIKNSRNAGYNNGYRNGRGYNNRRGHYHGSSRNLCYTVH